MLNFNNYVKVTSLEEAYQLNQKRNNVIIAGMMWLKMQDRNIGTAIDLSGLGLDTIEETEEAFVFGAMCTLRQMETHLGFDQYTKGQAKESVSRIVGIQFRNLATIGGSIFGRYGFSDVLTLFMALEAKVELYKQGIVSIHDFAKMKYDRDILVRVIVEKKNLEINYQCIRFQATDFPMLTCAISKIEQEYRAVIGARPGRAVLVTADTKEEISQKVKDIIVGSTTRASKEYRQKMIDVLVRRGLERLEGVANGN